MEGEFRHILISVMLICLFTFLLIISALQLGDLYDRDTSDLNSGGMNLSGINDTLNSAETTANNWKDTFTGQKSILGTDSIILTGIFDIGKTMWGIMLAPIYIILYMFQEVLMIPSIVSGVFVFIIIVAFIFSLWRLIRVADT